MAGAASSGLSGAAAGAAVGGPVGAAIGGVVGIAGALLGKKKAAEAIPLEAVDFAETSGEALDVNLGNLEDIEALIGESSRITDEQTLATLERLIPGYGNLQRKLVDFATEQATNPYDMPQEIIDQLARVSAERGFESGVDVRSGVGSFDFLRNLGISSIDFANQNISNATNIFGAVRQNTPIYSPLNPSSLFVTPGQVSGQRAEENQINQTILQGAENTKVKVGNENRQALVSAVQSSIGGLTEAGFFNKKPAIAAPVATPGG